MCSLARFGRFTVSDTAVYHDSPNKTANINIIYFFICISHTKCHRKYRSYEYKRGKRYLLLQFYLLKQQHHNTVKCTGRNRQKCSSHDTSAAHICSDHREELDVSHPHAALGQEMCKQKHTAAKQHP